MEWSNNNDDTESEGCSLASYLDIWIVLWRCIGNVECREGGTNDIITITLYYYIAAKCTRNIPISISLVFSTTRDYWCVVMQHHKDNI